MSLRYEACYLVVYGGKFDLVTSCYQFGNILTAARPLLTARVSDTNPLVGALMKQALSGKLTHLFLLMLEKL